MITVAETRMFQRKVARLLSEHEREDLVTYLAEYPNTGIIMEETGGIRKLRWARSGRGKSGGLRVIYYFHDESMPLYLLTVFGKNEKANLSKEERNSLAAAVKKLVAFRRQRNEQSIH
ncbi:MAG: addiction module toxin RelE [Gammaproteobacteria bacterium RIFCSPLOWO2_12_FULL_52_10]|nr:MAG: addiction module toxin RelE [Gammaproteobacteria bacterium RIFCSPLOWO2_12_FULL_52_10]